MKFFWQIIASVYSVMQIAGLDLPTPSCLFHKPRIRFPKTIVETIRADVLFDSTERRLILQAAEDIFRFTNKRIKYDITFDLTFEIEDDLFAETNVILKSYSTDEYIQESDKKYENNVIGLCYFRENQTKCIYLVSDRLRRSDNLFRTTTIHEFGHYLGMNHTTGCSIMQPINKNLVPYPTYTDAVELARVWRCLPSDLGYFKL